MELPRTTAQEGVGLPGPVSGGDDERLHGRPLVVGGHFRVEVVEDGEENVKAILVDDVAAPASGHPAGAVSQLGLELSNRVVLLDLILVGPIVLG